MALSKEVKEALWLFLWHAYFEGQRDVDMYLVKIVGLCLQILSAIEGTGSFTWVVSIFLSKIPSQARESVLFFLRASLFRIFE